MRLAQLAVLSGIAWVCWRNLSSTLISLYHYSDHTSQNCNLRENHVASTLNIENIIVSYLFQQYFNAKHCTVILNVDFVVP